MENRRRSSQPTCPFPTVFRLFEGESAVAAELVAECELMTDVPFAGPWMIGAAIGFFTLSSCGGKVDGSDPAPRNPSGGSPSTGGQTSVAGATAAGGSTNASTSTSTANDRTCTTDADCTQCIYIGVPTTSGDCNRNLGCCGGQVMNFTACAKNRTGWETLCSLETSTIQQCPCIGMLGCNVTCKSGECGYWCN